MTTQRNTHKHEWKLEKVYHVGVRPQTEVWKCTGCKVMKIVRGDFVYYNYIDGGLVE